MNFTDEIFTDVPLTFPLQVFLDGMVRVRRDLYLDLTVAEPWSCDPDRCRARLGPNLCCKVQKRCRHLQGDRCTIHDSKPFLCTLFPLDLVRVGGNRVVTTIANLDFFNTGWARYDRDMLRCFEGAMTAGRPMFQAQEPVLASIFTKSELLLMKRALAEVFPPRSSKREASDVPALGTR